MTTSKKELQIIAPIGDTPSRDEDLRDRIGKLPSSASLSEVFREINEWEEIAVQKDREQEQTAKSGNLVIVCR